VRIVIDTNLWVSGLLWRGLSGKLLRLAEAGKVELCMTPSMLAELAEVLSYERFQPRLTELGLTTAELIAYAMKLASVFEVSGETSIVAADPDDDVFLHCAAVAKVAYVVSGDHHLLDLGEYASASILTVRDFLAREFPQQVN
jgi:putative PIN family toxin of toxin-antitoxin system